MTAMDFKKFLIILAVFLSALLIVQPVVSEGNVTRVVTNYTADLENDTATKFFNYGEQSLNQGDFGNAIAFFDQALAGNTTMLKKTDAHLYLYRDKGYAQIQLGKYTDAIATLDEGLASFPTDAMLWNNKGFALSGLGKNQEALAAYDQAISIDGNYTNALLNRANLLNKMGRYSEAVSAFTRANETDPFNINASDGLIAARKGEAGSGQTTTLLLMVFVVVAAGIAIWYVKFRKPSEPAPEEKKKRSKKKE